MSRHKPWVNLREWLSRLSSTFRPQRSDADLEQELAHHLELAEEALRGQGHTPEEASRLARIQVGQATQTMETLRDQRNLPALSSFWLDAKLGVRMLRKSWGLTLVGGAAMAIAITLSAAAHDFLHALSGTRLPLKDGDRIVAIQPWDPETRKEQFSSVADFAHWRSQLQSVQDIGAFYSLRQNLVIPRGESATVIVAGMSPEGFRVARVNPILGRPLLEEDQAANAPPVTVLGYDLWKSRFSGDSNVLGQQVQLGGTFRTVVGIMPEGFLFPVNHEAWIPLQTRPLAGGQSLTEIPMGKAGGNPGVIVFARLAPNVNIAGANAEVEVAGLALRPAIQKSGRPIQPRVVPFAIGITGNTDAWLIEMIGFVLALLLIPPCANIAILIYARTVSRQGEFAVRSALGANRGRIVGQVFVEVLVLALGAAAISLVLAQKIVDALHDNVQRKMFGKLPFWMDFSLSYQTILYVVALAILAAFLAGAIPAMRASGGGRLAGLHALGTRSAPRLGKTWTALVVLQVAVCVATLPVASQLAWWNLRPAALGPGFAAGQILTARLSIDSNAGFTATAESDRRSPAARFTELGAELVRQLTAEGGGIPSASMAASVPSESPFFRLEFDRASPDATATDRDTSLAWRPQATVHQVDGSFFRVFRAALLTGRSFEPQDLEPGRRTVLVNRSFAEQLVGGGNPLGRRVRFVASGPGIDSPQPWWEIIGVVEDRADNGTSGVELYRPLPASGPAPWLNGERFRSGSGLARQPAQPVNLLVRTGTSGTAAAATRLRERTASLNPALRLEQVRTMQQVHEDHIVSDILGASVVIAIMLGLLALSIAGIYTLMAFTVAQRRREIGIRAALGASPTRLVGGIFRSVFVPVGVGAATGGLIALWIDYYDAAVIAGLMEQRLQWTLPAAEGFILVVAAIALSGPIRRSLEVDPSKALREG